MPSQHTKNLLIVEGEADKRFVERFLQQEELHLSLEITPVTPIDINPEQTHTTKGAVFNELPTVLKQLADGLVERLGILVDMDYQMDNPSPIKTHNLNRLADILHAEKFVLTDSTNHENGIFFNSTDYEHPIGIWLMPDNNSEGYLESWIKQSIDTSQQLHWQKIQDFISSFEDGHFKPNLLDKALVYTWLATQPKPSQDLCYCLKPEDTKPIGKLLDNTQPSYQNFKQWLVATFS